MESRLGAWLQETGFKRRARGSDGVGEKGLLSQWIALPLLDGPGFCVLFPLIPMLLRANQEDLPAYCFFSGNNRVTTRRNVTLTVI